MLRVCSGSLWRRWTGAAPRICGSIARSERIDCWAPRAAASCAEGYGVMKTALAMTIEYLRTREQFGVKIGTFQALQHRAVDMLIESELLRSMAIMASIKVDEA